jgi:hypothetical protein
MFCCGRVRLPGLSLNLLFMSQPKLINQEIAIVIAVKTQNPTILNEDFLKYSGIVPADWQLAQAPTYTDRVAQVLFTNGFSLAVQPDRVMFLEALGENKSLDTVSAANIASKYVDTLKLAEYQAVGINCRGYVSYATEPNGANKLITEHLLTPGTWQNFTDKPAQASINFIYDFPDKKLSITVNEATLQFPNQNPTDVVLFAGNFNYALNNVNETERVNRVQQIINNWQADTKTFTDLVSNHLLTNR